MIWSNGMIWSNQGPGDGVAVTLDNMKAMMSRDRGDRGQKDLASSQCVFAQAYRQLCDTDPKLLRTVWDGERVFQVLVQLYCGCRRSLRSQSGDLKKSILRSRS